MTEPSRKKRKGLRLVASISPVIAASGSSPHKQERAVHALTVYCSNSKGLGSVSLDEFANGTFDVNVARNTTWGGEFSGRPELIYALFPHFKLIVAQKRRSHVQDSLSYLRTWWRLLDSCETVLPARVPEDINDLHASLARQAGLTRAAYSFFRRLLNTYRLANDLPQLHWPQISHAANNQASLPEQRHIKAMHDVVKRRVFSAITYWHQSDAFAESGRDWSAVMEQRAEKQKWLEADIHATFRGALKHLRVPCASWRDMNEILDCPGWLGTRLSGLIQGLFPSKKNAQDFLCLFIIRTGWNEGTALNIDVSNDDWITINPLAPSIHTVRAVKSRGGVWQSAIGLEKTDIAPGNLIRVLLKRTEPLRNKLKTDLQVLISQRRIALESTLHATDTEFLQVCDIQIGLLIKMIKSPWLHTNGGNIGCLDDSELSSKVSRNKKNGPTRYMPQVIREANLRQPQNDQIPASFVASDFRDGWISFAYKTSGYSWLVASLAAGHKSFETLKHYLRQRQHRAHSAKKVSEFGNHMWREIVIHKRVEPAVLKGLVERGKVSDEQVKRWIAHKDMTRLGMGCQNIKNPPVHIDPHHIAGNGCRTQRCTLCEFGIIFDDSLHLIARRYVELIHTKANSPLSAWHESDFGDEFDATQIALRVFDARKVEDAVTFWQMEIAAGRYTPFSFTGSYSI